MKTKRKRLWLTTIATLFLLITFLGGCKDDNVEIVGVCPLVISTNPANLAVNVPLNQIITVTFNEAMNPLTITPSSFTMEGVATKKKSPEAGIKESAPLSISTPITGTVTVSGATATFTPTSNLSPNFTYTGTIAATVKDMFGNALQVNYVWTFSTGTNIAPTVISTDPLNLAVGVALNKVISANFSVAMDPLTITTSTFTLLDGTTAIPGAVSYSGITATFTPTSPLLLGKTYTATITTGVKNSVGTAIGSNYVWTFSTGAVITPTVISVDPLDLATNVALNKVLSANFSVAMNPLTITTSTFTLKDGATTIPGAVSYSGITATFTPTSPLLLGKTYTATITTGVKNVAGTAIGSNYIWTFSTGAVIIPTVISVDPLDLATNVVLNKMLSANFSIAMDPLTITTTTFTLMDGVTPVLGAVNYSGTTATFTPTVALSAGKTYTTTITTGAKNIAGTAIGSNYVWTFSTGAVIIPTVISTDPLDLATGVALNKAISATFSVLMDNSTITTSTFTVMDGVTPVLGSLTFSGATATFTPTASLLSGKTYTVTVTTGVENLAGTPLANNHTWTFSTISSAPTVVSTVPINLAVNVPLNQVISATFSEAMDNSTITNLTFTLMNGVTPVGGSILIIGSTAYFTPTTLLLSDATYTATITTGVQNLASTPLASDYVWTFSTVAHKGPIAPDLLSVARFGIISGVGVTNAAGPSEIHDLDVGIYPGVRTSITGFMDVDGGPGLIINGAFYASDDIAPPGVNAMLNQAKLDLVAAYLFAEGATSPAPALVAGDQGGTTLYPGIYKSTSTLLIQSGDLTLDAQGDVNATWIFQIASDFTTIGGGPYPSPTGGNVILSGGAQAKNIYWQVGSSAIIGDYTSFKGNILALTSITMNSFSRAQSRMLTQNAAVTLTSTNIITKP